MGTHLFCIRSNCIQLVRDTGLEFNLLGLNTDCLFFWNIKGFVSIFKMLSFGGSEDPHFIQSILTTDTQFFSEQSVNWVVERYDEHSYWQILLSSHHTLFLLTFL